MFGAVLVVFPVDGGGFVCVSGVAEWSAAAVVWASGAVDLSG